MTANIPGGDDRHRQNRGVGDVRTPPVPPARGGGRGGAMPQAFHQRVDHDKSRHHRTGDRRLLLAMMLVGQPRSCQRRSHIWSSTSNQGIVFEEIIRSRLRRRASHSIAEGFSPTASAIKVRTFVKGPTLPYIRLHIMQCGCMIRMLAPQEQRPVMK